MSARKCFSLYRCFSGITHQARLCALRRCFCCTTRQVTLRSLTTFSSYRFAMGNDGATLGCRPNPPGDRSRARPVGEEARRSVGNRKERPSGATMRVPRTFIPKPPLRFARGKATWDSFPLPPFSPIPDSPEQEFTGITRILNMCEFAYLYPFGPGLRRQSQLYTALWKTLDNFFGFSTAKISVLFWIFGTYPKNPHPYGSCC